MRKNVQSTVASNRAITLANLMFSCALTSNGLQNNTLRLILPDCVAFLVLLLRTFSVNVVSGSYNEVKQPTSGNLVSSSLVCFLDPLIWPIVVQKVCRPMSCGIKVTQKILQVFQQSSFRATKIGKRFPGR